MGPRFYKLRSGSPVLRAVADTDQDEVVCSWELDGKTEVAAFKRATLVEVREDGSPL